MDALFRTIHDTGPTMKTFIRPGHPRDFGVRNESKNVLWAGFDAEFAARTAGAVNLNRHGISPRDQYLYSIGRCSTSI
jgi:hypothetical protein